MATRAYNKEMSSPRSSYPGMKQGTTGLHRNGTGNNYLIMQNKANLPDTQNERKYCFNKGL